MGDRAPCVRCGMLLHTGEGRITISFQVTELEQLALDTNNARIRERLLCAIGLLDAELEQEVRQVISEAYGVK